MRRRMFVQSVAALGMAPTILRAQAPEKVSIGVLRLSSSGPLFIARDRGHFREQGLEVEPKIFTAAQQVPVAVTSGDADFGVTGLTAGFFNLAGRGALKIIAGQSREAPGFQLNAYMATAKAYDDGFHGLKDLPGKRIGITTTGSTFHYSLGLAARKLGFDLAKVTMVALQQLPAMAAAFKGNQVEGVVVPVTIARALEAEAGGKILGWVGDETPWQLGALFTSPKAIAERRPVVERFVRAWAKGCAEYHAAFNARDAQGKEAKGPGYDELLGIIAKAVEQPPERVAIGLPFIDPQARLDVGDIHSQVAFWQAEKQVREADAKAIVDLSFVQGHINVPAG
ncbi:MAG: ABC transporter substrate-binding protein [Alphaproteobacteria bacterium]|nr:ABC transporter substrate-binding protein [Alphaproteobacteria bacterium]